MNLDKFKDELSDIVDGDKMKLELLLSRVYTQGFNDGADRAADAIRERLRDLHS